jgi:tetratricopeptide (TPR) repeat protein
VIQRYLLPVITALFLLSCSAKQGADSASISEPENQDLSCSYFYFLWGSHAEYDKRYPEALDAYEKALVCDSSAEYIKRKLPLLLLKTGDVNGAVALLQEEVRLNPQDTARRILLARIFIQERDDEAAIEQYQRILSYDPTNEQVLLRLGGLMTQVERYDTARDYLMELLEINPESYYAHVYLARIAGLQNDRDTALFHYEKALGLNWSTDLSHEIAGFYAKNKEYRKSIEVLRAVLEQDESDEQARLGIVQSMLAEGKEEEAIAELRLARRYSDSPERISLVLSRLYLKNGDDEKAIENLESILEISENSEARYILGVIYSESETYDRALETLTPIGPDVSEFEDAVFMRTRIMHELGREDEAIAMLEGYLADSESARPLFYVLAASLYHDTGGNDRSLQLLETGLTRFPDDEQLLFEYGLQLERSDRLEEGIQVMQQVLEQNPDHAEALNFIGYSWADANRNLDEALNYILRAMELKPGNGYIQDSLGWVYFRLGNLERAEKELRAALELVPDDPHISDHLGDVYSAMGEYEKARQAYLMALEKFDSGKKRDGVQKKLDDLEAR